MTAKRPVRARLRATPPGLRAPASKPARPPAAAILLAAGRGRRMRGAVDDKVLAPLAGQPVFAWSLASFIEAGIVAQFVVVFRDAAQRAKLTAILKRSPAHACPVTWVRGGDERQHSVAHALEALPGSVEHVYIHDCARPLVHPDSLRSLADTLGRDGAACLAHRMTDTIKRLPAGAPDTILRRIRTIDRSRLWAMETPQAFERLLISEAYRTVHRRRLLMTDDASALELATSHGVTLVENQHPNPKITTPADLAWAEFLLRQRSEVRRQTPAGNHAKRPPRP